MARARKRPEPEIVDVDEAEGDRDYVMARLASASVSLKASAEAIDEALALFNNPDDDKKGKERKELVATALETAGCATRALEAAEGLIPNVDFELGEPWDDDEEDEEEDDDEDEDEDE